MMITYIRELHAWEDLLGETTKKIPKIFQKCVYHIKRMFRIGKTIQIGQTQQLKILPYTIEELLNKQTWYKKQLKKEKNVIVSKSLFQKKTWQDKDQDFKLWDGKSIFRFMVIPTIEYISQKIRQPVEDMNVAILVSDCTQQNLYIILELAERVKNISIVTKKIGAFKKWEEKLYEEKGIAIKLSNNKKKSIKKEKIILNVDLTQEQLNQYEINQKAILVHLGENIQELPKRFSRY